MNESPTAIVTGATGGIGRAIASALGDRGYRLLLHGWRTAAEGEELAAQHPGSYYLDADLADPAGAELLARTARERLGRLDVLVNNAGVGIPVEHRDLEAVTPEFFDLMIGVNLAGPWHLIRACAEQLKQHRGSVINMSSMAASTVSGSSIPYAVSKAGLEHLTRLLAAAMGPEVRVNALAPGLVDTERTKQWQQIREEVIASAPLRRSASPEDIAVACLALLDAQYVTGAILPVDGGQRLV